MSRKNLIGIKFRQLKTGGISELNLFGFAISLTTIIVILAVITLSYLVVNLFVKQNSGINGNFQKAITLPAGFKINVFASDLGGSLVALPGPNKGPRFMEFYKDVLFVSVPSEGRIYALPDSDKDGKADEKIVVIDGLSKPHGIAFYNDWMYTASEDILSRIKIDENMKAVTNTREDLTDLPSGGHWTRTIRIKDDKLYISIGSSCNVCIEDDERRASILRCDLDGNCRIYARGIRNAVGFVFDKNNTMWATENSRDRLGENLPPDEINIVRPGKHYGWPFCYGDNIPDPEYGEDCSSMEPSHADLQAHSAPLGLSFNYGKNFPEEYLGDLFVAYHGSWNRKEKTGYKIVSIDTGAKKVTDFAAGWLKGDKVSGRPVDIIFDKDGVMYVTDDFAGVVYRVWYGI